MPAVKTTIASFPNTGGTAPPDGALFMDSNGDLIGATVHGGANSWDNVRNRQDCGRLRHHADFSGRHTR